jgi:hypothetical protein
MYFVLQFLSSKTRLDWLFRLFLQLLHRKIEVKCQSNCFAAAISSGEEAVIPTTLYPLALASFLVALILPFHFDQHALNHKRSIRLLEPQEIPL